MDYKYHIGDRVTTMDGHWKGTIISRYVGGDLPGYEVHFDHDVNRTRCGLEWGLHLEISQEQIDNLKNGLLNLVQKSST